VSRIERARVPGVSVEQLARLLAVVGLDLSARAYPFGLPLRDAAQLGLLSRFEAVLHASLRLGREVPLTGEADLRAWDAVLYGAGEPIAVEAKRGFGTSRRSRGASHSSNAMAGWAA
jgi:hypothetical protein